MVEIVHGLIMLTKPILNALLKTHAQRVKLNLMMVEPECGIWLVSTRMSFAPMWSAPMLAVMIQEDLNN